MAGLQLFTNTTKLLLCRSPISLHGPRFASSPYDMVASTHADHDRTHPFQDKHANVDGKLRNVLARIEP